MERLYLLVDHVDRLELLVPHGVKLVQLRIKDQPAAEVRRQISRARNFCTAHGAQLVINDYWREALDLNCSFVHLGQGDMESTDFAALRRAGVRFGLSTHDEAELDHALAHDPAYVALGPIYPTVLKKMECGPQGLHRIAQWKRHAGKVPLVAIGGLTPERAGLVFAAGADSAAVMSDIQQTEDPETRINDWLRVCAL